MVLCAIPGVSLSSSSSDSILMAAAVIDYCSHGMAKDAEMRTCLPALSASLDDFDHFSLLLTSASCCLGYFLCKPVIMDGFSFCV